MKKSILYLAVTIIAISLFVSLFTDQADGKVTATSTKVFFEPVNIYIDSGEEMLAAYQFEIRATTGEVKIVGIEGGEHAAFAEAPYYDPAALQKDHIIIAAFNTSKNLPKGKTRVATLHMQITGDVEPEYEIKLVVAANADGQDIEAKITFEQGEQK